jgi:anti-sigma regulatory factor (Ser/Thr protein kinase)
MARVFEHSVEAELENLKDVRRFVQQSGRALGIDEETLGDLCLVVDEAVTNVILHGYDGSGGSVDLCVRGEGQDLVVTIRDSAPAFEPSGIESPHLDEPLVNRKFGGMGVYLIRKLTDEVEFRVLPDSGNELYMRKRGVVAPAASQDG